MRGARMPGIRVPPRPEPVERALQPGPQLLHEPDDLVDHPVDGLHDGPGQRLEDLLDLVGDATDPEQRGQETDEHRDGTGQRVLDQCGYATTTAPGDRDDRVEDGVDELDDLPAAFDDEPDDVDDQFARANERRRGVQQRQHPHDARDDDGRYQVRDDLRDERVLQVADLLPDVVPEPADALPLHLRRQRYGRFGSRDRLFRHALAHDPGPDRGPGEAEQAGDEQQDALGVELLRQLQSGLRGGTEQPGDQALFEVLHDVAEALLQARPHARHQVAQEPDRVGEDEHHRLGGLGQDPEQHVLQFDDGVDDALDRVDGIAHQAL